MMIVKVDDQHEPKTLELFKDGGTLTVVLHKEDEYVDEVILSLEGAVALKRGLAAIIKQMKDF